MEYIKLYDEVPFFMDGEEAPTLKYFAAENRRGRGTVLIFPGGGYMRRAEHEGDGYARFFNANGLDAFVLEYRVEPYRHPVPLLDARRAIRTVRKMAEELGLDPEKIAVMGSSAGGHLAAHLATTGDAPLIDDEYTEGVEGISARPNAQILCYPVTNEKSHLGSYKHLLGEENLSLCDTVNPILLANENTPPAFIWHTETDNGVRMQDTLAYAARLHELDVRTEMHIYPTGGHGLGLAEKYPSVHRWTGDLIFFLTDLGYIEE